MSEARKRKSNLDRALREARSDYAHYVGTEALFSCQRAAEVQVNPDELAFQIVHQVEELWMKLAANTLIDLDEGLRMGLSAPAILRGFTRVHALLRLMTEQLSVLSTLSPKAYGQIRTRLGQGSGQDSPGYRALTRQAEALWPAYQCRYLAAAGSTLADIYEDTDQEAFAVAEALIGLDTKLARFRHAHLQLVDRMIGLNSRSLKGLPAVALVAGVDRRLFPELWAVRGGASDAIAPDSATTDSPTADCPTPEGHTAHEPVAATAAPGRRSVLTQADWQ